MTEDESKQKWCPFVRMEGYNRTESHFVPGSNCIGSECMAWRWGFHENDKDAQITSGYCGLAGKP